MDTGSRTKQGTVLRAGGGTYQIALEDGTLLEAVIRGRLKLVQRTGDRVVAGDRVMVLSADGSHTIEQVLPRTSQLARRAPGRSHRAKVIVANVDQVVIVMAAAMPEPRLRMLDRLLVLAESNEVPAVVVVNKVDLRNAAEIDALFKPYEIAGYSVLRTSVNDDSSISSLKERLCGFESVLTGPSGVGKSSLLNAVQPGLRLRVGDVSEAIGKGKHTTVTASMSPLDCGGYVADTPGLREVGLWDVETQRLDILFPEFRPLLLECRYGNSCSHTHEPGCAIKAAVEQGDIDRGRYESYCAMLAGDDEW